MGSDNMSSTDAILQPSSSSMATAIAAAFNIIRPHKMAGIIAKPEGAKADEMKKWAALVGDCAQIIVEKVKAGGGE